MPNIGRFCQSIKTSCCLCAVCTCPLYVLPIYGWYVHWLRCVDVVLVLAAEVIHQCLVITRVAIVNFVPGLSHDLVYLSRVCGVSAFLVFRGLFGPLQYLQVWCEILFDGFVYCSLPGIVVAV